MTVESIKPVNVLVLDFSMPELCVDSNDDSLIARFYRGRKRNSKTTQVIPPRKAARIEQSSEKSGAIAIISRIAKRLPQKQSRRIERYDAVSIEDLNMRGMAKSLNFGEAYLNGCGMFRFPLIQVDKTRKVLTIDMWFPS
ncbi:MAG: hypothetical protein LBU04_01310 [Christensenellaceae bacterium]|nr:hypothetical protein [Christensenellaceae bacterium]